jgi:hypothetical protein
MHCCRQLGLEIGVLYIVDWGVGMKWCFCFYMEGFEPCMKFCHLRYTVQRRSSTLGEPTTLVYFRIIFSVLQRDEFR